MKRTANAHWRGDLKTGKGDISTASGVLTNTPYSFQTRFEQGKGTNPEELLAAAHAGCFTMAVSAQLASAGLKADTLDTACTITLEQKDGGFAVRVLPGPFDGHRPRPQDTSFALSSPGGTRKGGPSV